MHTKPLGPLLIKPAGRDCNLACEYCFYLDRSPRAEQGPVHRMNSDVLEALTRQALATRSAQVAFCWQGGEPTLMGLDFFREACHLQDRHGGGRAIENSLQTNGILITPEWAAFLAERGFLVGLSLDGPEHVHDRYRMRRGGSGSWRTVTEKAQLLLDAGVEVNALVVVNDHSVRHAEEIYQFLVAEGITWMQFIPCVEPDPRDPTKVAPFSVSGQDYGRFLNTLFDLWWDDLDGVVPGAQIRFFDAALHHHVGLPSSLCTHRSTCGDYLVVEHDGSVYPCDFYVAPDLRLGNVLEDDLQTLLDSSAQTAFGRAKAAERVEQCETCEWLSRCWGGCPKDRRIPESRGLSHLCEGYRSFFAHANDRLSTLADRLREASP